VLGTLTDQPIAGAQVEVGSLSATTNEDGRFTLTQPVAPSAALRAKVNAAGYLVRETSVGWPRSSGEPLIDLIATTPPFSMTMYKQLVRDDLESDELFPIYRWTTRPRVSLHPFDDDGRPLPPHVLSLIRDVVPRAVAAWSGGRFTDVALEEVNTPDWEQGWIVLHVVRSRSSEYCGVATFRYLPPGEIVTGRAELTLDLCGCGSQRIPPSVISHEIAHAMGFWHVEQGRRIMAPQLRSACGSFEREVITDAEGFHARIAASRPTGNRDPDVDPDAFTLATDGGSGERTITCRW
jgi:hypothetical protein